MTYEDKRVVVWDIETKYMPNEGEEYVDYVQRCGISMAATWDDLDHAWALFGDKDIDALVAKLESADLVVGYNSVGFDHVVLDSVAGRRVVFPELDLWRVIQLSMGASRWAIGQGTLDAVSRRTLGHGKRGSGSEAPELAQRGAWFELANYCMYDVELTAELWRFMENHGYVINPVGQKHMVGKRLELEGQDANAEPGVGPEEAGWDGER